jgi:uncharacterized protein (TIGR03435 family)
VLGVSLAGAAVLYAQTTAPAFEAASIKPVSSASQAMIIRTPPSGVITASNINALMLIWYAYDVRDFRVVDAPPWANTEHFQVTAKAPANSTTDDIRAMMRALLAERFHLQAHRDTREMPIDVLAPADGEKGGPGLKASAEVCDAPPARSCGQTGYGRITAHGSSMDALATSLTVMTKRVVVNKTGLTGRFDYTLVYTPDDIALAANPERARAEFPNIDPNGPTLRTALREQLGIDLRTERGPVDVVVVDRLERPTAD